MNKYSNWGQWSAIHDLDARVEALEAAQLAKALASYQPGQAVPKDVLEAEAVSEYAEAGLYANIKPKVAPTPEQREPGWYPVWKEGQPWLWRWSDLGNWISWDGITISAGFLENKYKIGARIPEPGE